MAKNRVQLSLLIDDIKLYEEFILPLKAERSLADLIVKLLSAYYYDDAIGQRIDQSMEAEEASVIDKRQDLYRDINETMAMMDFLMDEGRAVVEDSTDALSAILSGAEEAGVAESVDTGYGNSRVKFNFEKAKPALPMQDTPEIVNTGTVSENGSDVEKRLSTVEGTLQSIQTMLQQLMGQNGVVQNSNVNPIEPSVEEDLGELVEIGEDASGDMMRLLDSM